MKIYQPADYSMHRQSRSESGAISVGVSAQTHANCANSQLDLQAVIAFERIFSRCGADAAQFATIRSLEISSMWQWEASRAGPVRLYARQLFPQFY